MGFIKTKWSRSENSTRWTPVEGPASLGSTKPGGARDKVLTALLAAACELTPGDIALRTGLDDQKQIPMPLKRMLEAGNIVKHGHGHCTVAGQSCRERVEGVKDAIKRAKPLKITAELVDKLTNGKGAPDNAAFVIGTDDVLAALESSGFAGRRKNLAQLKHRGVAAHNSNVVWLLGKEWGEPPIGPVMKPFGDFAPPAPAEPFNFPWAALANPAPAQPVTSYPWLHIRQHH